MTKLAIIQIALGSIMQVVNRPHNDLDLCKKKHGLFLLSFAAIM